jgi:hypothetical protein
VQGCNYITLYSSFVQINENTLLHSNHSISLSSNRFLTTSTWYHHTEIQTLPLLTTMPPRVVPPPPVDPSSDPSNPFYVHLSGGPSSVKVTPPLNGSNYHAWARSMRRALGAKLKFEFLDGSISAAIDAFDPSYRA